LTLANIEGVRYHSNMAKSTDPDILLLQGIADPTRLAILRQLSLEVTVCACDFTDCCGVGQPTISHHLKVLRVAGWVESERRGTWIYYSVRPEALGRMRALTGELVPGIARPRCEISAAIGATS
jgi:ArsR family transcriptional regulator